MTNSEPEYDPPAQVQIKPRPPKVTPPGWNIVVSEAHAQMISEFVASPTFKLLKKVIIPQRKDLIARAALNGAQFNEQLFYYKGMAAELKLLFKALEAIQQEFKKRDGEADKKK